MGLRKISHQQLVRMNETEIAGWRAGTYDPPADDPREAILERTYQENSQTVGRSMAEHFERQWATGRA